ncbi:MAG: 50S ribosomal protein L9 [Chloroflexi bacterium]|nr:50S ribosomal protein L9 [Chloroflexota bacterium]
MKVILLQDVYNQGVAGELVDVAPGYARNYLIPQGMAVKATPGALRQLQNLSERAEVRRAELAQHYEKVAEKIEELTLYFPVRAGESGKLYGSVTTAEIAEQIQEELGLELDKRRVGDRPLRELGDFDIPVRLDMGFSPMVKVVLFREGEDPRLLEAEAEVEEDPAEAMADDAIAAEEVEDMDVPAADDDIPLADDDIPSADPELEEPAEA